jgi:hypothetical protein
MMRHGLSLTASLKSNGIIGSGVNLESVVLKTGYTINILRGLIAASIPLMLSAPLENGFP